MEIFAMLCALLLPALALFATEQEEAPYLGEWSNGRGETLVITDRTIRFNKDAPVPYRDITRATDGGTYELQITARGEVNAFSGKFLAIRCEDNSMEMTGYRSHADYLQEKNPQQKVRWERESGAAE